MIKGGRGRERKRARKDRRASVSSVREPYRATRLDLLSYTPAGVPFRDNNRYLDLFEKVLLPYSFFSFTRLSYGTTVRCICVERAPRSHNRKNIISVYSKLTNCIAFRSWERCSLSFQVRSDCGQKEENCRKHYRIRETDGINRITYLHMCECKCYKYTRITLCFYYVYVCIKLNVEFHLDIFFYSSRHDSRLDLMHRPTYGHP